MKRYTEDFSSKLLDLDFGTLENSESSIYALSEDLNLIYFNPAFIKFSEENGVSEKILEKYSLGTSFTKAVNGEKVKKFYKSNYRKALDGKDAWHHEFECSSKNNYRLFHQGCYPLKNGKGLIIISTLMVNLPMDRIQKKECDAIEKRYIQDNGLITQCSNCRHVQSAENTKSWHWIPQWVEKMPPNVSHEICPICYDYHWKNSKIKYNEFEKLSRS